MPNKNNILDNYEIFNFYFTKLNNNTNINMQFDITKKYGYEIRSSNHNGLLAWNTIKDIYIETIDKNWMNAHSKNIDCCWKELDFELTKNILKMEEYYPNGDMNEPFHFIMQCVKIPIKNSISLIKIMQIAYNIGQLKASENYIPKDLLTKFYEQKMYDIDTYVKFI